MSGRDDIHDRSYRAARDHDHIYRDQWYHANDHGPTRDHDHLRDNGPAYSVRGAYYHDHYTDVRGAGSAGNVPVARRLRYFYDITDEAEGPDIGGEG